MNSPLVTLGSIFVISAILSQVSGELPRISTCGLGGTIRIRKGDPCFIHCSVTDLQEDEEIVIVKVGVRYYGWNLLPISKSMEIEYYNKSTELNPGLPDRYTAHPGVNQVNITLSVALPEDMGFFECWLRKGTDVTKGGLSAISVEGGVIEQYWERLDGSGNQVERFEKDEKITIEYDDITQLAFRAKIVEPLNQIHLIMLLSNDLPIDDAFERANLETIEGEISEVGLIKGFTSSAHYHSPSLTAIPLTSTVEFKNRIILGIPLHPESGYEEISLNLAVQAVPQVQADPSDKEIAAGIGDTFVFNCWYASNPGPPSFLLQVPGRNETIKSGDDEKFDFVVIKSDDEDTPYLYNLKVTYKNIAEEVFGTNRVYGENQMGRSPLAYNFTITSAGSKPGLPLLVPVISTLIAIASFASRF